MSPTPKVGDLRVCWFPQVPCKPFIVHVTCLGDGVELMNRLASYDAFQLENRIKPDYCNTGCIERYVSATVDEEGNEGPGWEPWMDDETGEDDPAAYLENLTQPQTRPGSSSHRDRSSRSRSSEI